MLTFGTREGKRKTNKYELNQTYIHTHKTLVLLLSDLVEDKSHHQNVKSTNTSYIDIFEPRDHMKKSTNQVDPQL